MFTVLAASGLSAQTRLVLPEGSVIIVRTSTPLESATAKVGQTFETVVSDTVRVDNYTVIPAGSRIRGVVTFAQAANRQQSGVIGVDFDRLALPDGKVYGFKGKLTSTDAAERRQIESDPNARVVLVGGRGGVGAAIAGAGSEKSPASGILAALGSLLSEARDVKVPAGTPLAVQLEQGLVLSGRGSARAPDAFTIYTGADRIREAQRALAQQNYYRGAINGQLDDATEISMVVQRRPSVSRAPRAGRKPRFSRLKKHRLFGVVRRLSWAALVRTWESREAVDSMPAVNMRKVTSSSGSRCRRLPIIHRCMNS